MRNLIFIRVHCKWCKQCFRSDAVPVLHNNVLVVKTLSSSGDYFVRCACVHWSSVVVMSFRVMWSYRLSVFRANHVMIVDILLRRCHHFLDEIWKPHKYVMLRQITNTPTPLPSSRLWFAYLIKVTLTDYYKQHIGVGCWCSYLRIWCFRPNLLECRSVWGWGQLLSLLASRLRIPYIPYSEITWHHACFDIN